MNIEIYKGRCYPEFKNLFSADNCNWAYGNNEFLEKAPGENKHILIQEKETILDLLNDLKEKMKKIWPEGPPVINFIFSARYNSLGTRQINSNSDRYVTFEELSEQEFCEFLKELSLNDYFNSIF